ncbi:hypothetical protein F383_35012 [Gossypium arboreum]|uniref:Uncharacterized protein n=1 Tax=Gossypium arboreum TaxID=29729 RepID=A0A0B0PQ49_GOSAR|nr:hypothetical protein F383_35012 [Gossypium arboreum]
MKEMYWRHRLSEGTLVSSMRLRNLSEDHFFGKNFGGENP